MRARRKRATNRQRYEGYENEKQKLTEKNLTPREYEKKIQAIAKRRGL